MATFHLFLVFSAFFFVSFASASPNIEDAPDQVEVWYLMSPLMYQKYGDLLGNFNLYHAGVGFIDRVRGENWTVDFAARDFLSAIFPQIIQQQVVFYDDGVVQVVPHINSSYWKNYTLVGYASRSQLSLALSVFVGSYLSAHPKYNLVGVWGLKNESYVPSMTCQDFVWDLLSFMYEVGMKPIVKEPLKHNFVVYHNKGVPLQVDYAKRHDDILAYYSTFVSLKNMTIFEIIDRIFAIFSGEVYMHYGAGRGSDIWYKMDLFFPFLSAYWLPEPLPRTSPHLASLVALARASKHRTGGIETIPYTRDPILM